MHRVDVTVSQDDLRVRVGIHELVDEESAGYVRYGLDYGLNGVTLAKG